MSDAQTLIEDFWMKFVPLEAEWHLDSSADQSHRGIISAKLDNLREKLGRDLLALGGALKYGETRRYTAPYGLQYIDLHWKVDGTPPKQFKIEAKAWMKSQGIDWDGAPSLRVRVEAALQGNDPSLPTHWFKIVKPTVTLALDTNIRTLNLTEEFARMQKFRSKAVILNSGSA